MEVYTWGDLETAMDSDQDRAWKPNAFAGNTRITAQPPGAHVAVALG